MSVTQSAPSPSSRGKGPRAIRVGNTVRYRRSEVERWLDEHTDTER